MTREIELLTEEVRRGRLAVEKASNRVWEDEELGEAAAAGQFAEEDQLAPPASDEAVTSPYPGCLQLGGAATEQTGFRTVGQTRHFVLFERV
jgi:hypothetical protein